MASRAISMSPMGAREQPNEAAPRKRGAARRGGSARAIGGRVDKASETPARSRRAGVPLGRFLRLGACSTSLLSGLLQLIGDRGRLLLHGIGAFERFLVVLAREGLARLLERSLVGLEIALEQRQIGPGVLGDRGDLQVPLCGLAGGVGGRDRRLGILLGLLLVGRGGRRGLARLLARRR